MDFQNISNYAHTTKYHKGWIKTFISKNIQRDILGLLWEIVVAKSRT